jgi:uncharacterized protein YjdB
MGLGVVALLVAAVAASCGGDTTTKEVAAPTVSVDGDVAIEVGATATFTATTKDGTDSGYEWSSSDEAVATVDADGVVTGVAEGTAIITALGKDTAAAGTWGVHIYAPAVEPGKQARVFVSGPALVKVGESITLEAKTVDGTDVGYAWSSSDDAIATVDEKGVVTGVAVGAVTLTAKGTDTKEEGSWNVYVYEEAVPPLPEPVVTITGDSSVKVGETIELTAATTDGEDSGYDWASSDDDVATVDADGVVTGVAEGPVVITATGKDTGASDTFNVYVFVVVPPTPVVTITGDSAVKVGETLELAAATQFANDSGYDWLSSDETLATVDADGVVTGVAEGPVVITATGKDSGASDTFNVYVFVVIPPTPVVSISGDSSVKVGETLTLTAATQFANDSGYEWKSSDEAIATVDADGVVTGVAEGPVVITATGLESGASDAFNVFVYVVVPPPDPEVFIAGPANVKVGETIQLTASTKFGTDAGYTWKTSDAAIATVDAAGNVKGIDIGPAVISATGNDTAVEATWNVYVWDIIPPPPASIVVTGPLSAIEGQTKQFVATTFNGNDTGYTWKSDNAAIATVDAAGLVTAVAPGQAIISATGKDSAAVGQQGIVVIDYVPAVPFEQLWEGSGHADTAAVAFNYWNSANPAEIPVSCAKCHSTPGYLDFLGVDGSTVGTVDKNAPIGTVVTCTACHNSATAVLDTVTFPSGAIVTGLGDDARCMLCHQGRESTVSVDKAITDNVSLTDADAKGDGKLGFKNIHYFAAGATRFGGVVKGAYQYTGKHYDGLFVHAESFGKCNDCHNPHTLEVQVAQCGTCHAGVDNLAKAEEIRMPGSGVDFDGDGNIEEGILGEIDTLHAALYVAIKDYAKNVNGQALVYEPSAYPYFFKDLNGNGLYDAATESGSGNKYAPWTPRLLRAAFNYQFTLKDPGKFAHNAKYIIQVLYDSLADLGTKVTVDMSKMHRTGEGHFDSDSYAWRRWDTDGAVSSSCARCHSPSGFQLYAQYGVDTLVSQPPSDGLECFSCHTGTDYANGAKRRYIAQITFPSTKVIKNDAANPDDSLLCAGCHMGREAKYTIDTMINGGGTLSFKNVHYLPAASIQWGKDAGVAYEYTGKTYAAKFGHFDAASAKCTYCHNLSGEDHTFKAEMAASCKGCHASAGTDITKIRTNRPTDYDGDGNNTEKLADELATLGNALYKQMQTVGTAAGKPLVYDEATYPYFFNDKNANGLADPDELNSANKYSGWTAGLIKASHNFQIWHKEPGAWAHNTNYMAQLLIDSIADLGGDVATFKRP